MLHGALQGDAQQIDIEGLGDEVVGADPNGAKWRCQAAKSGHHDDRHIGAIGDDALAQLQARQTAHVQIGDHNINRRALQRFERRFARGAEDAVKATTRKAAHQHLAHRLIVIDDK